MAKEPYILDNWVELNAAVMDMAESQVKALLKIEVEGQMRPQFINRLHGRFNVLRRQREQAELFAGKFTL